MVYGIRRDSKLLKTKEQKMDMLWLDFETKSLINLKDSGLDIYAKHPSTKPLMLAWAFNDEEVSLWQPRLGVMPPRLFAALNDPTVLKCAWNYNFEKDILEFVHGIVTTQDEWYDPSVLCAYMSLPIGLHRAGDALAIHGKKIHITGDDRPVKLFSGPSKTPKKKIKLGAEPLYFKDWETHPAEWEVFCEYCKQDVTSEREVHYGAVALKSPMTVGERKAWLLDQRMNERGVWIDKTFVANVKAYALEEIEQINGEIKTLTGLGKITIPQLKVWLEGQQGRPFESLDKEHLDWYLTQTQFKPVVLQVLALKKKLGGSAYTKLQSIEDRIGADGRLRDQFVYHGAHTGRWSGRGVQLQNLFKPTKAVSLLYGKLVEGIRNNDLNIQAIFEEFNEGIEKWNKDNPTAKPKDKIKKCPTLMDVLAGTIRASFAGTPSNRFVVGDLAQIESRVLAGIAGCQTMIDAYASGHDLYKEFMAWMLGKPIEEIDSDERARGKVVILGCGFQMGWMKFIEYAATYGITLSEKQAKEAVYGFREKYKEVPELWEALNSAVIRATKMNICIYVRGLVIDGRDSRVLKIKLPSGRYIHYLDPKVIEKETPWGAIQDAVQYTAFDKKGAVTKDLYGGLLTENVVQAIARDLLLSGMEKAEIKANLVGGFLVMTIHDEIVLEVPVNSSFNLETLLGCMTELPLWAEGMGFVLAAEGWEGFFYRK